MRVEFGSARLPQNPTKHPILIRPFNIQFLKFPPLKFRSYQADRQMPAWIIQGLDGNPVSMFPIFIAVRTIPLLQPFQVVRVHIISLPASAQLLINAVTEQLIHWRKVGACHDQSTSLSLSQRATAVRPAPTKPIVLASLHHSGLRSSAKETSSPDFTDASFRASAGSTGFGSAACLS